MDYAALTRTALFAGIATDELAALFAEFTVTEKQIKKGEILALQGEPCNRLIVLLTGAAKGEMSDASGRVVKVDDIVAPNPLAILFLFGPENRFPVQATATEDSTAVVIPRQTVLRMLSRSERLLENYLNISATFAARLSRKLHFMSLRTIRQKLAMYLLDLSKKSGSDAVLLDRTHLSLAEYFGVSRQALEREMKAMAADGLIARSGKKITISEKQEMVRLVSM
ncbi:MAG: Crp/Fnr family transcriptional regulator [Rikenellaceae bacterium]|jgi:CRP-like cAMP-binding protein|nr:Crp/Fnr family transcriptional regulator [Rikenellaceae bacterium]